MTPSINAPHYLIGIFDCEDTLLRGVRTLRQEHRVQIAEVYSPYPVHGLDVALGYKRSFLPKIAFLFGLLGTCLALGMQAGMMTMDWPMIIGGKDFFPLPVFIPITFEITVLLAAFGMVGVFFAISDLKPWKKPIIYDIRSTDDKHVLVVSTRAQRVVQEVGALRSLLQACGAEEIKERL